MLDRDGCDARRFSTGAGKLTHLEIKWPDEALEQVRAARGRLEVAGLALRAMSLEERLLSVARVLEDWTTPDSPWRRELTTAFAESSPFHEETVREGLDSALGEWNPEALIECAHRELSEVLDDDGLLLSPFAWTAVLSGGTIPMPTMLSILLPLILGSPVLLRESSNDRTTAGLLKRSLEARSEILARAFESLTFATDDVAFDSLIEAPCVVATGSDDTIRSISARIRPHQRFVAYAHRFSIGVVGPAPTRDARGDGQTMEQIAKGFAVDVARWDQTGCLSPVVVFLVGSEPSANRSLAHAISDALNELSVRMPRGEMTTVAAANHANERAEARMRQASAGSGTEASRETLLFEGKDYTVVLEANADPRPAPLHRFLRLMPVVSLEKLDRVLEPFSGQLSSVALAGFSSAEADDLSRRLLRFGPSRFTRPGRLQTPPVDWPHDGMPLLTPLARLVRSDRPE